MKIKVEIISKELVKPSSPTPYKFRRLHFSFIDQHIPNVSPSLVHFFAKESTISNLQKCKQLKKSLSKALAIFYPLAGRVRNESYIECNDDGFLFVEAKASCKLIDVLREKNPTNNSYFTPFRRHEAGDWAGFAQVTFLQCGGLVISFGMSHKLGDASSMFTFLNSWAAINKGNTTVIASPSFCHATAFPPINNLARFDFRNMFVKENHVTKIFIFHRSSIDHLQQRYTTAYRGERRLSRTEALTGFITVRFMASTQAAKANNRKCMVAQAVDLRSKMEPPMPKQSFGNLAIGVAVEGQIDEKDEYCIEILERIRESTRIMVENYKKIKEDKDIVRNILNGVMETYGKEEVVSLGFTSVHGFPAYETDFGWGKPLWVGSTLLTAENQVHLYGSRDGESIEAWICLSEEDMAMFEADEQLRQYISSTSSGSLDVHVHSKL